MSETDPIIEQEKILDDDFLLEEEEEELDPRKASWKDQKYIPNKKRFVILSVVFTVIQLTALLLLAFVFKDSEGRGLYDFGVFIICPTIGLAVSYFVENKKEAIAVSAVNSITSVLISLLCLILVQQFLDYPTPLEITVMLFGIPAIFIIVQIAIAFTMARVRVLYGKYGDSTVPREGDEAMIAELRESRIERGLETAEPEEE
ncbi:MAG: hypothetical protein FK732_03855 [Asgard group archaeon]|nr:hypothetical protein [Asgard group archaeon]